MSVNKVILIGNLGSDPDIKTFSDGGQVANLSVATSESWKNKQGEKQTRTEWHRVCVFGEGLIKLVGYLHKGSKVYLEGKLQTRKYEQDGITKYTTEIVLQGFGATITFLDDKKDNQQSNQQNNQQRGQQSGGYGYGNMDGEYRA